MVAFHLSTKEQPHAAIKLWFLSGVLDAFDGYLARKLDQTSSFGALLDVVADNIWRTSTWIAAAQRHANTAAGMVGIAAVLVPSVEWFTLLATQQWQVLASNSSSGGCPHWKDRSLEDPVWVQAFFSHRFFNPIGAFGVHGLYLCPILIYAFQTHNWDIPFYNVWMGLAVLGRLMAFSVEAYLCFKFVRLLIERDLAAGNSIKVD